MNRYRLDLLLFVVLLSTSIACSTPSTRAVSPAPVEQERSEVEEVVHDSDPLRRTLAKLMPAETRMLFQVRPDLVTTSADKATGAIRAFLELAPIHASLTSLDRSRPTFVAVAVSGSTDFIDRAWLGAPATDPAMLPAGIHVRTLLPSSEPSVLRDQLMQLCGGQASFRVLCSGPAHFEVHEKYVSVDFLTPHLGTARADLVDGLEERAISQREASTAFARSTPALRRFFEADVPFSLYAPTAGIQDVILANLGFETRSALETATPENADDMLFFGQGLTFMSVMLESDAIEFEDITVLVRHYPAHTGEAADTDDTRYLLDIVRTYTASGRKIWQKGASTASFRLPGGDGAGFDLQTQLPVSELLTKTALPSWSSAHFSFQGPWLSWFASRGNSIDSLVMFPLVAHPAGLLRAVVHGRGEDAPELLVRREDTDANDLPESLLWQVRLNPSALPDTLLSAGARAGLGQTKIFAAAFDRGAVQHLRLQVGGDTFSPPAAPDHTDDSGFEPASPEFGWQNCMKRTRLAYTVFANQLDQMTPQARRSTLLQIVEAAEEASVSCGRRYPAHANAFRRAAADWKAWKTKLLGGSAN